MIYKTKDAILNHIPELNNEDLEKMNYVFEPYLFFKDNRKDGYRECWCTHCNNHFYYDYIQRTETDNHYMFIRTKHNQGTTCPKCGATVTAKETYRAKGCKNLEEWKRIVLVKPIKDAVYLLCYYGYKEYTHSYLPETKYELSAVYYIAPGSVRIFKEDYDYTYLGLKSNNFYEPKSICEPFTKTWWYNISAIGKRGYDLVCAERLEKTFLKYAPLDLFYEKYGNWFYRGYSSYYTTNCECPFVKFICYYALYPNTEKLLKLDLSDFVFNLIHNKPMKRYIDWNAKKPKDMFGMNKAQFKDFREHYYGDIDFKVYQLLKKVKKNIPYSTVAGYVNKYAGDSAVRVAQAIKTHELNITHAFNYLEKHTSKKKNRDSFDYENTAVMWTDYLKFAAELKYDLSRDDVIFPKNLKDAHDEASANIAVKHDAEAFEKYQKRYEKLRKMYEYSNGEYRIVIPLGVNDIIEEGQVLCHCVKGYASRHMNGKTTILFMRRVDKPNRRLITIEVNDSDKRIAQHRGKNNRNPTKDEQQFINEWIAWVKAGSKKNKKKNTAESAA